MEQTLETLAEVARDTGEALTEKLKERFDFVPEGQREEREVRETHADKQASRVRAKRFRDKLSGDALAGKVFTASTKIGARERC